MVLNKLHKTLVTNVNEINGQPIFQPYTIVCHPYIIIKINNLHNNMHSKVQMKEAWEILF